MILLIRKRTLLYTWLAVCMIGLSAIFLAGSRRAFTPTGAMGQGSSAQTVVIDPGHGGQDGGAVAGDGTEESRINLAISLRLEQLLRFAGVPTEMTRREDCMVCDPGLDTMRQRKVSDIRNRTALVNGIPNAVLLSIHQNSLPSSPATHGAQAFQNRQDGAETLAQLLQCNLNAVVNTHRAKEAKLIPESIYLILQPENRRAVKEAQQNLYILSRTSNPAVMVECGFLSNAEETLRLRQADYQMTLAVTIAAGYLQWAAGEEPI